MATDAATGTIIDGDEVHEVRVRCDAVSIRLDPADLERATGWALKPEGLCQGDTCIPTALVDGLLTDAGVDLAALAAAIGRLVVVDPAEAMAAFGAPAAERSDRLTSLDAPPIEGTTIDGERVTLDDYAGRKKLLMAFASWCGCRYDLPAWQAIQDELGPHGLSIIGVAVDESDDDVRPWVDEGKADFPVIVDRDHVITDRYQIVNVPTVVWIDETDRIVRPNDVAFGSDMFKEFHGVDSSGHHDALRRWVVDGDLEFDEEAVRSHQLLPTDEEQRGRLHYRLAVELRRRGHDAAAARHFARAGELAPDDWTVRRAALPLQGIDPFVSDEFIELFEKWKSEGGRYYGISEARQD
jgi:peroxiredoxin